MGNYDFDPSASRRSPAFKRLASQKAGSSSADPPGNRSSIGSSRGSIFKQVQVSKSAPWRESTSDPRLARLEGAADDNSASASTLYALCETSQEVQEANIGASAASLKEVEAAVRLAEELRKRIVDNDQTASEAHAEKLSKATVERLLRS
jgi:hypothetical protein